MGSPAILGTAGMTLSGASTGINVVSKLLGAQSSKQQYLYQARMAQINENIAKQNANFARSVGERENLQFGLKAGQRAGQILAAQGASGIDVNSEGPASVRASQSSLDKMDREQILENAARRAYGHDMEAFNQKTKGAAYSTAAKNATKAGNIGVLTSLISGATSVADKWYQGKVSGMWDEVEDGAAGWGGRSAKMGA